MPDAVQIENPYIHANITSGKNADNDTIPFSITLPISIGTDYLVLL